MERKTHQINKFSYPEGATPLDDYSYLKPAWVQTQHDLNRAEAENISVVLRKYLNNPTCPLFPLIRGLRRVICCASFVAKVKSYLGVLTNLASHPSRRTPKGE